MNERWGIAGLLLLLAYSASLWPHGTQLFAAAEGPLIRGRVTYQGGASAAGVRILVDAGGERVAELRSDAEGRFGYRAKLAADHLVVADFGDGHRAQWLVPAGQLVGAFGVEQGDGSSPVALESALARQIQPLREELAAYQGELRFRDVLGGIGYLFGLAGLALWWQSRRGGGGR